MRRALGLLLPAVAASACGDTSMFAAHGSNAAQIAAFTRVMLLIATIVAVLVLAFLALALFRRRTGSGDPITRVHQRATRAVAIFGGVIPAAILLAFFSYSLVVTTEVSASRPADTTIEVIGHDWWWEFRYPGTTAVTANEMHIPVGRRIELQLRSADVIHSFWVPDLAGKTDVLPGQTNTMWLEADTAGAYHGACAEYCGFQHAWMRILVIADPPDVYARWLANEARPAAASATAGEALFANRVCSSCHTIRGVAGNASIGPDLTHVGARTSIGAGIFRNSVETLHDWIADPQHAKPGSLMPRVTLSADELDQLARYLEGLK
ncbi:MAG: cytochrome c oxidase subunit II [Chloroflexota bacterium]|nr:cytochrome c oxidase subunit II [Chloroflexota bacterium]